MDVLRSWAVQDSPPGAATAALVARGDVEVGWLDRAIYEQRTVVALYNARSATAVVPAEEAAAYGTAQLPYDGDGLKALLKTAAPEGDYEESAELAFQAIGDALDGVERRVALDGDVEPLALLATAPDGGDGAVDEDDARAAERRPDLLAPLGIGDEPLAVAAEEDRVAGREELDAARQGLRFDLVGHELP